MKKQNLLKRTGLLIAGTFMFAMIFSACKKDEPAHIPAAQVMVFNLVPDQDGVGVAVDNNAISNVPIPYPGYLPYRNFYAGNRVFSSFIFGSGQTLATTPETLRDSGYYSLFVVGGDDIYKNVITEDMIDSLDATSGKAFVRYVNGVPGDAETTTTISADQTVLFNDANKVGTVSAYKEAAPGKISVTMSNPGATEPVSRDIDVTEKGVYTVLLIGEPQATDTARALKIRVVHQGNL